MTDKQKENVVLVLEISDKYRISREDTAKLIEIAIDSNECNFYTYPTYTEPRERPIETYYDSTPNDPIFDKYRVTCNGNNSVSITDGDNTVTEKKHNEYNETPTI